MRINKYIALATGMSRRAADVAIAEGRVEVNQKAATPGQDVSEADTVKLNGQAVKAESNLETIILNKPVGYVCSRNGQGSKTIYDILPDKYHRLKPVGRLDKDSSGLLLLTNDGKLAHELTHPSKRKSKIYEVELAKQLEPLHQQMISDFGVSLDDGISKLQIDKLGSSRKFQITMYEGRNRQIRRTFAALGYQVIKLHRVQFGSYRLGRLSLGEWNTKPLSK